MNISISLYDIEKIKAVLNSLSQSNFKDLQMKLTSESVQAGKEFCDKLQKLSIDYKTEKGDDWTALLFGSDTDHDEDEIEKQDDLLSISVSTIGNRKKPSKDEELVREIDDHFVVCYFNFAKEGSKLMNQCTKMKIELEISRDLIKLQGQKDQKDQINKLHNEIMNWKWEKTKPIDPKIARCLRITLYYRQFTKNEDIRDKIIYEDSQAFVVLYGKDRNKLVASRDKINEIISGNLIYIFHQFTSQDVSCSGHASILKYLEKRYSNKLQSSQVKGRKVEDRFQLFKSSHESHFSNIFFANVSGQNLDWLREEKRTLWILKILAKPNKKIPSEISQVFDSHEVFAENLEDGSLLLITSLEYLIETCSILDANQEMRRNTQEIIFQKLRDPKQDLALSGTPSPDSQIEIINNQYLYVFKFAAQFQQQDFAKLAQKILDLCEKGNSKVTRGTHAWGTEHQQRGRSKSRSASPFQRRSKSKKWENDSVENNKQFPKRSKSPTFKRSPTEKIPANNLKKRSPSPPPPLKNKEKKVEEKKEGIQRSKSPVVVKKEENLDMTFNQGTISQRRSCSPISEREEEQDKKPQKPSKFGELNENQIPFGFPISKDKVEFELDERDDEYIRIQKLLNVGLPKARVTKIVKHQTNFWKKEFIKRRDELLPNDQLKEFTVFFQYSKHPRTLIDLSPKEIDRWETRISSRLTSLHTFYNKSNRSNCSVLGCIILIDAQEKIHACYSAYIIDFKY